MSKRFKGEILEWIKTLAVAGIIALSISLFAQPTTVSGLSMYPTLNDNELLLVNKLSYKDELPQRGDIIIFKTDLIDIKTNKKKDLVKRVIALPGEHLVIKNNEVYIEGKYLQEDYLKGAFTEGDIDIIVPKDHLFVMGDNRENSNDSRKPYIGTIDLQAIIGKAYIRVFPFNKVGTLN